MQAPIETQYCMTINSVEGENYFHNETENKPKIQNQKRDNPDQIQLKDMFHPISQNYQIKQPIVNQQMNQKFDNAHNQFYDYQKQENHNQNQKYSSINLQKNICNQSNNLNYFVDTRPSNTMDEEVDEQQNSLNVNNIQQNSNEISNQNEHNPILTNSDQNFTMLRQVLSETSLNSSYCHQYLADIIKNMVQKEVIKIANMAQQPLLSAKSRSQLIQWISGIVDFYNLDQQIIHSTVKIHDNFIAKFSIQNLDLYQMYGIACFIIASKFVSSNHIALVSLVCFSDFAYSENQLKETEFKILNVLNYKIDFITPYHYLNIFADMLGLGNEQRFYIQYLLQLINLEPNFIEIAPIQLFCGAFFLSNAVFSRLVYQGQANNNQQNNNSNWPSNHAIYTGVSKKIARTVGYEIFKFVLQVTRDQSQKRNSTVRTIKEIFQEQKYMKVGYITLNSNGYFI